MTSNFDLLVSANPVFVIGGRGFVGSHIVRALLEAGRSVHVFGPPMDVDLLSDLKGQFGETHGSVLQQDVLAEAMTASGAGSIVTNAAFAAGTAGLMRSGEADTEKAMQINVEGFRRTLEAARLCGINRIVWSDSTVVYGPAHLYGNRPVTEADARRPTTLYGLTKVLGEDIGQYYRDRYGMDVVGLRMALLLGRDLWYRGAASAIAGMIENARPGRVHEVSFHNERIDLMHVADIARAVVLALQSAKPMAPYYNVNGFTASLSDIIAATTAAVPGYEVAHEVMESPLVFPLISDAGFRRDTGYLPQYGLAETIQDLLEGARR